MGERGRFDPDLGYWAEQWDPTGRVYPLTFTSHIGPRWVNVTTLPALFVGWELYRAWGYRGALLVPMVGSVLAALAARALARRMGASSGWAWAAFWLTGLASPLAVYALDFWEHSLGVALMAWGVVVLLDWSRGDWRRALGAGALFGLAATMRTEALVFAAVALAVIGLRALVPGIRAQARAVALLGALFAVGLVLPLVVNARFERSVFGRDVRGARTAGIARTVGGQPGSRVTEGVYTVVGMEGSPGGVILGLALIGAMAVAARRRDEGVARTAAFGGVAVVAARAAARLGFVPGVLTAAPLAAVGLASIDRLRERWAAVAGVLAIPAVVAVQSTGFPAPQWGARYLLTAGLLLSMAGVVALAKRPVAVRVGCIVTAVAVTAFGVVWMAVRSHEVAHTMTALDRRPEPVVVSTVEHLAREGGAFYGDKRWLTAPGPVELQVASDAVGSAGYHRFLLVQLRSARRVTPEDLPGWKQVGEGGQSFLPGVRLRLTTWVRS